MASFEIRPAGPDDVEAAVGVWGRARWDAKQARLQARLDYSHGASLRHFRDVVMPENEVFVAVASGEVVGLLAIAGGKVNQIHVDPRWQGRGVGTALIELAKEQSPRGLTLSTFQENQTSRRFYEARGFRAIAFGISPAPESEPDVTYRWEPGEPG